MADPRSLPMAIWSAERRRKPAHLIFFENSPLFPTGQLYDFAQKDSMILFCKLCPSDIGWPVRRRRLLSVCIDLRFLLWTGPSQDDLMHDISSILFRATMGGADMFCTDSDASYQQWLSQLAGRKHIPDPSLGHDTIMSPSARQFLDGYMHHYATKVPSGTQWWCDVLQNPVCRPVHGNIAPSMTTKTMRFSCSLNRLVTPRELWSTHGWPTGELLYFDLQKFSFAASMRLLGNGMHLAAVFTWIVYIMSNCVKRSDHERLTHCPFRFMSASSDAVESEGD